MIGKYTPYIRRLFRALSVKHLVWIVLAIKVTFKQTSFLFNTSWRSSGKITSICFWSGLSNIFPAVSNAEIEPKTLGKKTSKILISAFMHQTMSRGLECQRDQNVALSFKRTLKMKTRTGTRTGTRMYNGKAERNGISGRAMVANQI